MFAENVAKSYVYHYLCLYGGSSTCDIYPDHDRATDDLQQHFKSSTKHVVFGDVVEMLIWVVLWGCDRKGDASRRVMLRRV